MNYTGVFRFWNEEKGYGFIAPLEGGPDVFAHVSALPHGLIPFKGMKASYDLGPDRQGREMAIDIEPV
jgi:CspA family cold shock protein